MATISSYPFVRHLRAEPNQHILHFQGGRVVAEGPGISYWFFPLSAAVAQLPVEDNETTFLLHERSADFQAVAVQCAVRYRCVNAQQLAARINFSISLRTGGWLEQPLERLSSLWAQKAQAPARRFIVAAKVTEIMGSAELIRDAVDEALRSDAEIAAMGLAVVHVQVVAVSTTADVDRALQTPTRELIQQKADEAVFSRRALAVEKERAIKENELNTQIELAKKEEHLIQQNSANELARVRSAEEAERLKAVSAIERERIAAEGHARDVRVRSEGEAAARKLGYEVDLAAEAQRLAAYAELSPALVMGLAAQEAARKITSINHLNISPDLLGSAFSETLRKSAGQ
jgi:hypothetical protein